MATFRTFKTASDRWICRPRFYLAAVATLAFAMAWVLQ